MYAVENKRNCLFSVVEQCLLPHAVVNGKTSQIFSDDGKLQRANHVSGPLLYTVTNNLVRNTKHTSTVAKGVARKTMF